MRLEPAQQVISAQVWVCHDCGAQDHKSCGCAGATAYSEALLEKRAQDRARQRRHREKSNENNEHVTRDTNVVNTDEFQPAPEASAEARKRQYWADGPELEPDPVSAHSAFLIRADVAARSAFYMRGKIDAEIIAAAEDTAAVWARLVSSLKEGKHIEVEE
jgi:hypothetical protein